MRQNFEARFKDGKIAVYKGEELVYESTKDGVKYVKRGLTKNLGKDKIEVKGIAKVAYQFLDYMFRTANKIELIDVGGGYFNFSFLPEGKMPDWIEYKFVKISEEAGVFHADFAFYEFIGSEKASEMVSDLLSKYKLSVSESYVKYKVNGNVLKAINTKNGDVVFWFSPNRYKLNYAFYYAESIDIDAVLNWFINVFKEAKGKDIKIWVEGKEGGGRVGNVIFHYDFDKNKFLFKYDDREFGLHSYTGVFIEIEGNTITINDEENSGSVLDIEVEVSPEKIRKAGEELADYIIWLDKVLKF